MSDYLSFRLPETFIDEYRTRKVDWGYTDAAGNSLGEITFLRTYSRLKEDGTKERWWEVCRRVVEGMFSIQKDHCKTNRLPWNDHKAQASAKEAYERLFTFKWTPPGRGLWMMGTPLVNLHRNSAALQNCAFISTADMTKNDPAYPFAFLMEASMLGIGVGFDNLGAEKHFTIHKPDAAKAWTYLVPDSREGWVQSVIHRIESYLLPGKGLLHIDTSQVRRKGLPIKTFGGTAAGPEPLERLHRMIDALFVGRDGSLLTEDDIADVGNLIGVCVVAGNVRRSAELLIGSINSKEFLNLKNTEANPTRNHWCDENTPEHDCPGKGWGWMSNNSVSVNVGVDYTPIVDHIANNGEPGVIWMDVSRQYGRIIDGPNNKDHRVVGYNPCAEQSLESGECCTLVETYLNRHDSVEDFQRTLKFAYLYAKTVTLLPTHWPRTNAIMQRNRRIGTSVSGIANFTDRHNMTVLRDWLNTGYNEVQKYDRIYSEWMGVRESIKTSTVKPSGTVSILAGESPGVHWAPGGEYFLRALRMAADDFMVPLFRMAGYTVEDDVNEPGNTVVIYFPIHSKALRSEKQVSLFEKANLAVIAQRYWSDNSVSVTLSFDMEKERDHIGTILHMHEGQLKTASFLPMGNKTYPQMPYQEIGAADYEAAQFELFKVDLDPIYAGNASDAVGEAYCTTDACEVRTDGLNGKVA
jgi:ribonucleoside-triphosphate reductase